MIANVLAFQAGWLACVLGAARGMDWIGPLVVVTILAWHVARATAPERALGLLAIAGIIGMSFEVVLVALGAVAHQASAFAILGVPLWMIALWPLFASTLNVSLRWLRERTALAAAFGLLGGPLSYWAGARLGAIEIPNISGLAVIALGWGILMPLVFMAARRFDGFASVRSASTAAADSHA